MRAEAHTDDEIPGQLDYSLAYKAGQRAAAPGGYRMLMNTKEPKTLGGQLALSVTAKYVQGEEQMIEYHTWITSRKTHAYLSARMHAVDFENGKVAVDRMLDSLLVP